MQVSSEQTLKRPCVEAQACKPKLEVSLGYRVSPYHRGKKKSPFPPKPTMVDGWKVKETQISHTVSNSLLVSAGYQPPLPLGGELGGGGAGRIANCISHHASRREEPFLDHNSRHAACPGGAARPGAGLTGRAAAEDGGGGVPLLAPRLLRAYLPLCLLRILA